MLSPKVFKCIFLQGRCKSFQCTYFSYAYTHYDFNVALVSICGRGVPNVALLKSWQRSIYQAAAAPVHFPRTANTIFFFRWTTPQSILLHIDCVCGHSGASNRQMVQQGPHGHKTYIQNTGTHCTFDMGMTPTSVSHRTQK